MNIDIDDCPEYVKNFGVLDAWKIAKNGEVDRGDDASIGIIDSCPDSNHKSFLSESINVEGCHFSGTKPRETDELLLKEYAHGTMVAGCIISAPSKWSSLYDTSKKISICGIAHKSSIMSKYQGVDLSKLDSNTDDFFEKMDSVRGNFLNLFNELGNGLFSDSKEVITVSISVESNIMSSETLNEAYTMQKNWIDTANELFVSTSPDKNPNYNLLVVAAGNDKLNLNDLITKSRTLSEWSNTIYQNQRNTQMLKLPYPALLNDANYRFESNIIVVGSCFFSPSNKYEFSSDFSNFGNSVVDILAPGQDVQLATPRNTGYITSGTSFAAPYVASVIAIVRKCIRGKNAAQVKQLLISTAIVCDGSGEQCSDLRQWVKNGLVIDIKAVASVCKTTPPVNDEN